MARYDKITHTFRAPLAAAWPASAGALGQVGRVTAVSINTSGQVVVGGAGVADLVGVVVVDTPKAVGDIVDVMLAGEIVEVSTTDVTNMTAGDRVHAGITGQLTDVPGAATRKVGLIVESGRLVVHFAPAGANV